MKACENWDSVEPSQGGGASWKLEGGYACYVANVTDCTDEPNPYLELTLNPLDPKTRKYMYKMEEMSGEYAWRHSFKFFVGVYGGDGIDYGRVKALTQAAEQTEQNNGFVYTNVAGGEQQLRGKWLGVVFRRYGYTPRSGKHAGEYREGIEIGGVCSAKDAIAGNYPGKWAEPRNVKAASAPVPAPPVAPATASDAFTAPTAAPAPVPDLADEDIPF